MMSMQADETARICNRSDIFVEHDIKYFDPRRDLNKLGLLLRTPGIQTFYVGFGMHLLSLDPSRERPFSAVDDYENSIRLTMKKARQEAPHAKVVWLMSNAITTAGWNGEYRRDINRYRAGDLRFLNSSLSHARQAELVGLTGTGKLNPNSLLNSNAASQAISREPWQRRLAASFDRNGMISLNRRAQTLLVREFPSVGKVDGFRMTDWLAGLSIRPTDGRHFREVEELKLSILLNLVYPPSQSRQLKSGGIQDDR
jgi:hypothetical protein